MKTKKSRRRNFRRDFYDVSLRLLFLYGSYAGEDLAFDSLEEGTATG